MQTSVPSGWNLTTALPTYQVTQAYNDANQPTTTTATAESQTYIFSQVDINRFSFKMAFYDKKQFTFLTQY